VTPLTDPPKTLAEGQPLPRTEPGARPLILVVDEHADSREFVKFFLERRGYRIVEAEDGESAIANAAKKHPDMVLLDVWLPKVDGLEAIKQMHELPDLHDLPVLFISGHAGFNYRDQAMAAGGVDYLIKPIDLDQLLRLIERYVSKDHGDTVATRC